MHPVINESEHRVRAGIRIVVYIILAFPIVILGNSFSLGGYEFIFTGLLSFGFFWVMYRFIDHRVSIDIAGLKPEKIWFKECSLGVLIAAFVMGLIFGVQVLLDTVEVVGFSWNRTGTSSWIYPLFLFFIQMLCVGFYEELITRSYLLTNLKEGCTIGGIDTQKATIIAVIFSSIIFSIAHGFNPNLTGLALVNIILAGVMLAVPYIITGRLAFSVGIHFAWNFFQGGVFGFRVSGISIHGSLIKIQQVGEPLWTGSTFGPEGGLIGTLGLFLLMGLNVYVIKKSGTLIGIHSNFKKTFLQFEGLTKENE